MNRAIVTGGGGFVGRSIVRILKKGGVDCVVIGRSRYHDLEKEGIQCYQGDISDTEFVNNHIRDADVVFHVAALAGIWGRWSRYHSANVLGTQNIVNSCIRNDIPVLVHTSTPSVVFGKKDIINGNEDLSYQQKYLCGYAKSKAIAEKLVLSVGRRNIIKTCAIRPHLIWGPEDPHLIPRLLERGRKGELKIVGDGMNKVDISYVDNVAHAHILAAQNLLSPLPTACGEAYFIGQERPVRMWEWINSLFQKLDIPPVTKRISLSAALTAGGILEIFHSVFMQEKEPKMTRFLAEQLAKSHYFSHQKAYRDFGYQPKISIEEGMDRLIFWLKST